MTDSDRQDAFAGRLKQRFDASVRDLDAGRKARIVQCREAALAATGRTPATALWLPAGAAAAVCLAVIIYTLLPAGPVQPPAGASQPETVLEQMEMISDLELYEDLEFYRWLERHELPS